MRSKGTAAELEMRRRIGGKLLLQGRTLAEVAEACEVSMSSVKRWKRTVFEGGLSALSVHDSHGRKPNLDEADLEELTEILLAGPIHAGYRNDLWTCARVAEMIHQRFDIKYHPSHVWKILRGLGFTCQKPEQHAREQDEEEVRRWRQYKWPSLKRGHAKVS